MFTFMQDRMSKCHANMSSTVDQLIMHVLSVLPLGFCSRPSGRPSIYHSHMCLSCASPSANSCVCIVGLHQISPTVVERVCLIARL